jgi:hypothetical protein
VILPRRAFPDEAASQHFVDLARRLHWDATSGHAPSAVWKRQEERITHGTAPECGTV